ncbi:MAG: glycine oxidase ThiO [Gemmatimonadales bacterium]
MSARPDVLIVGAGLAGASCARALAAAGRRVLLVERGEAGMEASSAAAGMLAPQVEAEPGDPTLALGIAARERYGELAAVLRRDTGIDVGHRVTGIALVAFDEARASELCAAAAHQSTAGLAAEWLDRPALAARHPGIGPAALGAYLAPRDGAVDNPALVRAVLQDARRLGAELRERETVWEVVVRGGRVTSVVTEQGPLEAPAVVLAAGSWSAQLVGLPRALPVEPVRGQIAVVDWPAGEPPAVLFGRGAYVVERRGLAILGSTMEHAGFEKATTPAGLEHIFAETGALLPALRERPVRETWAGLRPMTPDGDPIIGRDPEVENLFYATGHGREGILLGPLTGEIIRDLVVDGDTKWDIASYAVSRFDATA